MVEFADVVNRADIGMAQCGCRASLALETFPCCSIGDYSLQYFDGHIASQPHVMGLIYFTHPTRAEYFAHIEVGDGAPGNAKWIRLRATVGHETEVMRARLCIAL